MLAGMNVSKDAVDVGASGVDVAQNAKWAARMSSR